MKTLSSRIKFARTDRKKSQRWLAKAVGVSSPAVTGWESGKKTPTTDNLSAVSIALGVNFEWLMSGRGPMDVTYYEAIPLYETISPEWQETLHGIAELPQDQRDELRRFIERVVLKKSEGE